MEWSGPSDVGKNMVITEGKISFDKSRQNTLKRAAKTRLSGRNRRSLKYKKNGKTFVQQSFNIYDEPGVDK